MIPFPSAARSSRRLRVTTDKSSGLRALATAGTLSVLLYVGYFFLMQSHSLWHSPTLIADKWKTVFYPVAQLFPSEWVRPARNSEIALFNSALYLLLLAAIFGIFALALRRAFKTGAFRASDRKQALGIVALFTLIPLLLLLIVPGALSTDIFSYIWYGRIFTTFGDNPFVQVPADYAWYDAGRWLQWVYWRETPSVYGPIWVILAGAIAQIANALGGDIVNHVLGHRILASLAHFVNVFLIWKIAAIVIERHWVRPDRFPQGSSIAGWKLGAQVGVTVAYAWNPLLLVEFGANSHNDVLMLTGLLAALWLHLSGRWRLALVALALAALTKFLVVVFLPGYLWLLFWQAAPGGWREGLRSRATVIAQALLALGVVWITAYIPFWEGPATLKSLSGGPPAEMFVNSLGFLLRFKLADGIANLAAAFGWQPESFWTADAVGWRLDWPARWGPLLITATVAFVQTWKARTFPAMVVAWGWSLFAYLTVGAVWFWPWYVSWLVVVVALVGPGRLFKATMILCFSSMTLYGTYWRANGEWEEAATWRPLLLMVPPLAYVLGSLWLSKRAAAKAAAPALPPVPARVRPTAVPVPLVPQVSPLAISAERFGSLDTAFYHPAGLQDGPVGNEQLEAS